jgi:hypothetical protein
MRRSMRVLKERPRWNWWDSLKTYCSMCKCVAV